MKEWEKLSNQIRIVNAIRSGLEEKLRAIQAECAHPKLQPHALGEEWMERCPDCGHISYCYRV